MTNLKILFTVVATLAVFTFVANVIPQVQSAVPEEIVLSADMPPEELAAIGEDIYAGVGGCTACHGLGTRAPDIVGVAGTVCETRVAGQNCKDYLWESLVSPLSYIVEGFEPIMLDQSRILSQAELWTLVAFLEAQGGEITVNADDFAAALAADDEAAAAPAAPVVTDPSQVDVMAVITMTGCLACHALGGQGGMVAPPLEDLQGRDPAFIRESIVDPNASINEEYRDFAGTMSPTLAQMMAPAELDALVNFLATGGAAAPAEGTGESPDAAADSAAAPADSMGGSR
ncbi:c-type cytochrome [Candidatus Palauibacter sp.]|uniref:c-type cytochrome n=1 Tax=Candidatus Palauibacter sp. TaxID=3101350 RepID=UPI003B51CF50